MTPLRTLSIGGTCYDLFVTLGEQTLSGIDDGTQFRIPLGSKLRAQGVQGTCGGGAANTAVSFARLGCEASLASVMADDDWGKSVQHALKKEGVDTTHSTVVENEMSAFSLILHGKNRDRIIIASPGVTAHLHDITFDRDALRNADWVYMNSLHQDSCEIQDDILAAFGNAAAPKLSWNPGGAQIEEGLRAQHHKALLANTAVLLLNREEALRFAQAGTVEQAMERCQAAGAQIVCVTDGAGGATAQSAAGTFHCSALPCSAVDTTGAGDAFGSTLTWCIAQDWDLRKSLQASTINAVSVLQQTGAQPGLLTAKALQAALAKNPPPVTLLHPEKS